MTAAITLFFVLTIFILMTRFDSVALRQTGLSPLDQVTFYGFDDDLRLFSEDSVSISRP